MAELNCQACGHANPEGARFCNECGDAFAAACAVCGHENPREAKFCNGCGAQIQGSESGGRGSGHAVAPEPRTPHPVPRAKPVAEKVLASRAALEGERKQVTVLFADVKGSMEIAEQMDPEEWSRMMQRFFSVLSEGVERFEGFVDKFTGDGIMALFGAPIAREDHAQRACYAALHLRDTLRVYADELRREQGLDISVRMGINSGEVIVGKIGDDLRMEYTAQGHTVGLAQRLEQLAEPGACYLSESTARLVSGFFALDDLGTFSVKGASKRVRVFDLRGPGRLRTRLDVARKRGLSRFVGREGDLATLEAALEQASAGDGQVVGVVAEAGVGKSRLCFEFLERCRSRGVSVNEGHCPAHGKNVPYLALLELLRNIFAIEENDGDGEARGKIRESLLRLDGRFEERLPLVFDFLAVADPEQPAPRLSPEARHRQLVSFVRHLVQARGEQEPRILVIDDAHWIDDATDAFVAEVVDAVPGTRTLVLINFRPEYHADWMSRSFYRQLPLLPLSRQATDELLVNLLGRDPSLAGLAEKMHERTRGNPFFIEEVVRSLIESGSLEGTGAYRLVTAAAELEIPSSVQAVLAARIDRLPEREKQLLQTLSVIGKEIPEALFERVADLPEAARGASVTGLVRGEFLVEKHLTAGAGYSFKHPLTHEVAYRSQLVARRAKTHASVASAIEELYPDELNQQAALLAYHWEQAGDALEAGRWSSRASSWEAETDPVVAIQRMQKAGSFLAEAPESEERARLELEVCTRMLAFKAWTEAAEEEVPELFEKGQVLAEALGDRRSLSQLHLHYGIWYNHTRKSVAAFALHARKAAEFAEQAGDEGVSLAAAAGLALVASHEGRISDAIAIGKRALSKEPDDLMLGADYWWPSPVLWLQGFTLCQEGWAGQPSKSLDGLGRLFELARGQGSTMAELILHLWAIQQAELLGDAVVAMRHARQLMEMSSVFDSSQVSASAILSYMLAVAHQVDDDSVRAASCFESAIATAEVTGSAPFEVAMSASRLAVAYADLGQAERAQQTVTGGVDLVRRRHFPVGVAVALTMKSRVFRKTQGAAAREAIESALSEAEALVQQTGIWGWQQFLHVERAEMARLIGDEESCTRELREARRLLEKMKATEQAERVARETDG